MKKLFSVFVFILYSNNTLVNAAVCRSFELHGFIKMQEVVGSVRREVQPELSFEYVVVIDDDVNVTLITISEKSERILQKAIT